MSFETAVQTAIYQALLGNTALAALVTGVYDNVPQGTDFPYVSIGEDVHNEWDTDTTQGSDCSITIHVWSRKRGSKEVKAIQAAIYDVLHRVDITQSGYKIDNLMWENSQSFMDADGKTRHGVQTFRMQIETA